MIAFSLQYYKNNNPIKNLMQNILCIYENLLWVRNKSIKNQLQKQKQQQKYLKL